jgi:hypothetical protein
MYMRYICLTSAAQCFHSGQDVSSDRITARVRVTTIADTLLAAFPPQIVSLFSLALEGSAGFERPRRICRHELHALVDELDTCAAQQLYAIFDDCSGKNAWKALPSYFFSKLLQGLLLIDLLPCLQHELSPFRKQVHRE